MYRVVVGLMVVVLGFAAAAEPERKVPVVAVFGIEDRGAGLTEDLRSQMSDYLAMAVAATGFYRIVPQERIKSRLVDEKKTSYESCYDQSCQIEIGRELAAEKSLATSIVKLASTCTITAVLYDLRRATSEGGASVDGGCDADALAASIKKLVRELTSHRPQAPAVAPPPVVEAVPAPPKPPPVVDDAPTRRGPPPVYKRWWFWTLVGAVVVGTTAGVIAGTTGGSSRMPSGERFDSSNFANK